MYHGHRIQSHKLIKGIHALDHHVPWPSDSVSPTHSRYPRAWTSSFSVSTCQWGELIVRPADALQRAINFSILLQPANYSTAIILSHAALKFAWSHPVSYYTHSAYIGLASVIELPFFTSYVLTKHARAVEYNVTVHRGRPSAMW